MSQTRVEKFMGQHKFQLLLIQMGGGIHVNLSFSRIYCGNLYLHLPAELSLLYNPKRRSNPSQKRIMIHKPSRRPHCRGKMFFLPLIVAARLSHSGGDSRRQPPGELSGIPVILSFPRIII